MCGRELRRHREEEEQFEKSEEEENLTEKSCIRWDRQGHDPVREEVRRSAARAIDEIAIACRKGGAANPALSIPTQEVIENIGLYHPTAESHSPDDKSKLHLMNEVGRNEKNINNHLHFGIGIPVHVLA